MKYKEICFNKTLYDFLHKSTDHILERHCEIFLMKHAQRSSLWETYQTNTSIEREN